MNATLLLWLSLGTAAVFLPVLGLLVVQSIQADHEQLRMVIEREVPHE